MSRRFKHRLRRFRTRWATRKAELQQCNVVLRQLQQHAARRRLGKYGVRMRHTATVESDDWATLVKSHREAMRMSQRRLGELVGVSRETVWRWENTKQTPEDGTTVDLAVKVLGLDREKAFRATGLLPAVKDANEAPDPYAYVRAMGLDPSGRVVRYILSLDISEGLRLASLRRERELQLRDEQRRLEDLQWTLGQQAG